MKRILLSLCLTALAIPAMGEVPQWLWLPEVQDNQTVELRTEFELEGSIKSAIVAGSADNELIAFINGERVLQNNDWRSVGMAEVSKVLKEGPNAIAIRAKNSGGAAGAFCRLTVTHADGRETIIATNETWKATTGAVPRFSFPNYDDSTWVTPKVFGEVGGDVTWSSSVTLATLEFSEAADLNPTPTAKEVTNLNLLPGFRAELIYTVPKASQGSWVSMTNAPDGGLYVSDQDSAGLFHVQPAALGVADAETIVTPVPAVISGAQGLFWAFDALYVHVNRGDRSGLYRVTDGDENGDLDRVEELMDINGSGEHGPHAIIYTEDKQNLYINAGNHTDLPEISGSRAPSNWTEDLLLPRQWDANGHARGRLAPGGWIAKVNPAGTDWEIVSNGYRNEYDIALNTNGDLFAYDADMEWDMGSPWYRPTRICHAVSGSEFGWRSGTGKWPVYYEDSLPPVLNIGPGSPTGIVFGTGAKFPQKYRDALFILDWTFGTIHAVHMTPSGSSYTGVKEEFVSGSPLAVTDTVIGKDGALYFTVGGRGTQSALYRIFYDGDESTASSASPESDITIQARAQRRGLEAFHGHADDRAVKTAWPYLKNEDRFLRFAARLAVEGQPVSEWQRKALNERDPQAAALALIALSRQGEPETQEGIIKSLGRFDLSEVSETPALGLLRAYGLCFSRMGRPDQSTIDEVIGRLDPLLPSNSDNLNTELLRLLVYLDSPGVIDKGLGLMADARPPVVPDWAELISRNRGYGGTIQKMLDNHPPSRKIYLAFMLRNVRYGWSMEQREEYFEFINEAAKHTGGSSYGGFLTNIRNDALANCSEAEKLALASITGQDLQALPDIEILQPVGPDKPWTLKSAMAAFKRRGLRNRDFEKGRNGFYASGCIKCHRFDGAGGAVGPDLSSVSNKFSMADLLEAIVEPNNVISDQYGSSLVTLNDGTMLEGIVINQSGSKEVGEMEVYTRDPAAPPILVKTADVESIEESPLSQMPEGLIDVLGANELLDMLAYLMSRGNPEASVFK